VSAQGLCLLAAVAAGLLSVSCGSKTEAPATNELQSLTASQAATMNYIDSINGIPDLTHGTARLPRGRELTVVGWAVDSAVKRPASKVFIDIDGKLYPAKYGLARPDVVGALKIPELEKTGFTAAIPSPPGDMEHRLTVKIVSADGASYYTGMNATFILQ